MSFLSLSNLGLYTSATDTSSAPRFAFSSPSTMLSIFALHSASDALSSSNSPLTRSTFSCTFWMLDSAVASSTRKPDSSSAYLSRVLFFSSNCSRCFAAASSACERAPETSLSLLSISPKLRSIALIFPFKISMTDLLLSIEAVSSSIFAAMFLSRSFSFANATSAALTSDSYSSSCALYSLRSLRSFLSMRSSDSFSCFFCLTSSFALAMSLSDLRRFAPAAADPPVIAPVVANISPPSVIILTRLGYLRLIATALS